MVNMDKGLIVPKWVLKVWPKIPPKCPRIYLHNLSAQAQKFWISMKKKFHWVSIVRDQECQEKCRSFCFLFKYLYTLQWTIAKTKQKHNGQLKMFTTIAIVLFAFLYRKEGNICLAHYIFWQLRFWFFHHFSCVIFCTMFSICKARQVR